MVLISAHETPPPPRGGLLPNLVLKAAGWSLMGYVGNYGLRLISSVIMTRLLVPEMFGVMAIAATVQVVSFMLCDVGLRQAIVRSPRGDQQVFLDTAWTLQILRGFVIWIVCSSCAVLIARGAALGWFAPESAYADPQLPSVIVALALSSIILGFQSTKAMSSDRHFNQRQLAIVELVAQSVGVAVSIALGYATLSIWSFVVGSLVSCLMTVVMSQWYLEGPTNRLRMERSSLLELSRFGRWILVSSAMTVLAANGDRLMLANWIDTTTFGVYVIALTFVLMIEGAGARLFGAVGTAAFSKIERERPESLRASYYRMRLPIDVVFIGSAGFLFGAADAIVAVLYDDRYVGAGPILQVLSVSLLLSRFGLVNSVYIAIGKPEYLGILNATKTASLFIMVPLANGLFGFGGALWAIALHALATLPVIFVLNHRHHLNVLWFEVAVLFIWPVGYLAGLAISAIATNFPVLS